jgi:hypothetical protein
MTAFETLYAHLKAMNYKDAPLFVDGKLLFLNVGDNYHILYLDDSLFVVDFVNSIIQHYRPYDKKLYIEDNRSIDYLRTLDKIPDTFLDLMPAYLYYQELSGKSQSRPSILTIWPEATKFDFSPTVYPSECSTFTKYDIKELFLNTIGWVGKYSNKAKLDKDDFGTTHYHFDLKEFGSHYPLVNIESDKQSFYYCDYNRHSLKRFSNVYKNEIKLLKHIEKDFISEWKKELSTLNISFNEMKLSTNNFLSQSKEFDMTFWQTVSVSKLLMKVDLKNSFYSVFKKNYDQFNVDFCLCDGGFYYDGERVVYILKDDYSPTLNEQNQFPEEELFTCNSLKLYVSRNRNLINRIAELLNINHNNEVHSFFTDLEKGVENDIAQLDKMFEIFEQYRQARHSQLVSAREILYKMHQDYLGDAPII